MQTIGPEWSASWCTVELRAYGLVSDVLCPDLGQSPALKLQESKMMSPPTKLAYLLVPALGAVILGVACREQSPTGVAPPTVIERPDIDLAAGGSMSGRATTTIRMFDGRSIIGTFIAADTNTFQAAIVPAGASAARMTAGGKDIDFLLAVGDNGTPARTGTWTVDGGRRNKGPNLTLTLVAVDGAPVSELTLRVGGEILSRVATEWARVRGGWVAKARTTMLYRGGKLARSFTTTFDDPHGARIAYSRTPIAAVRTTPPAADAATANVAAGRMANSEADNCIFRADVPCDGSPVLAGGGGVPPGPCQAEIDGLRDAVTAYWAADASLILCLAGPWSCLGAGIAILYTAHQIDVWNSRLDACLAAI